jgi:hypothetical protein
MMSLEQELQSYLVLPADWDGYGGVPAPKGVVEDALRWLATLPSSDALPLPMVAGDGEVSLYWDVVGLYLEVSFPGDSTCHFIAVSEKERYGCDDLSIAEAARDSRFLRYYSLAQKTIIERRVNETNF